MQTQHPGILAHVDASKTHLTGRLHYAAGVIDELDSVDDDNQSDSLERQHKKSPPDDPAIQSSGQVL